MKKYLSWPNKEVAQTEREKQLEINGLLLVGWQIGTSRAEQGAKPIYFKAFQRSALSCPCFQ